MKTQVEELPESKVRLAVEVPEADVQHAYEHAASDLAGSIRVPGFRKGHVPSKVVMARVGRAAVWEEAVRSHIDTWFWNAATDSGIRPISTPEVEYDGLPGDNDTFQLHGDRGRASGAGARRLDDARGARRGGGSPRGARRR